MSPAATPQEVEAWLRKRLDAYQRYGHLIAQQAAALSEDAYDRVAELDDSKQQLISWLAVADAPGNLERAAANSKGLAGLLQAVRDELRRVSELERAYQRALEGILVDARTELAKLAEESRAEGGYASAGARSGTALDLRL